MNDGLYDGVETDTPILEIADAVDLLERPFEEPRFLVRHLIPATSIVLFSGDTGSAKTSFALHMCAAIASGKRVAERFHTVPDSRPVLFLNGEMSAPLISRYLREVLGGIDATLARGRLVFQGLDAVATFKFSTESKTQLEMLVADLRPSLVVLDSQRELLITDENDGIEVRSTFSWLRTHIVNPYETSIVVLHHLRKIGQASNSDRERVAGSRDILASVDVHLAAVSRGEMPMHALKLGKTRFPVAGVAAGAEWPVEAKLEYGHAGEPSRSIFVAGDVGESMTSPRKADEAVTALRAMFEVGDPLSRIDANATSGNTKRAWESMRQRKEIVEVGKRGRQTIYMLAELADGESGQLDLASEPTTQKRPLYKGLNRVNVRTGSDPIPKTGTIVAARPKGAATSEPWESGHGSIPIGNSDPDPIRVERLANA